jgi:PAS domain S-box-containing protein
MVSGLRVEVGRPAAGDRPPPFVPPPFLPPPVPGADLPAPDTAAAGPETRVEPPVGRHAVVLLGRLRVATGLLVMAYAAVVLGVGWALDVPALRGPAPTGRALSPLSAACLLLLGIALLPPGPGAAADRRRPHPVSAGCAAAVAAVCVLVFVEHAGVGLGLDRLLFPGELAGLPSAHPGRPASDTAAGLLLLAAAHLVLTAGRPRAVVASQLLAAGAGMTGVTAIYYTAYYFAFRDSPLRQQLAGMAIGAAVALVVLSAGTFVVCPAAGLLRLLVTGGVGGMLGRRLLAAAGSVPFLLGWLPVLVRQNGVYGQRIGVACLISGNAVAFATVSIVAAHSASRLEAASARAQRLAAEGHAELMSLIDNTSAVIYLRDLAGRYRLVNRQYERLFGVRREEIVGLTDHDLFPAEIADDFRANDLAAVARRAPVSMEEIAPDEDGPHTYITVKFPLLDAEGRPYAVAGISTDITARKRAEDEVQRLNAELEERVRQRTAELEASTRELDAFAYSVSHDLRAPLRSVGGFSELLLEDYGDRLDKVGQDYLHRLQVNVVRMGQMIDDLLDLSRATRVELRRQPVDLSELAGVVVDELRATDPGRDVDVRIADGLTCSGDPRLLRLMLANLLANAWKFTGKRPDPCIEVGSTMDNGERVFSVRDNGAGFSMRYAAKLFQPFQRLHPSAEFDGSGLGLAIVQRILHRHGGRIWAESEPDHGATFSFTLTTTPTEELRAQRRDLAG